VKSWPRYLWAALNARPAGMPVAPAWFAMAAFALLGAFVDPAFYMIGGGLTAAFVGAVASSPRFRRTVDATDAPPVAPRADGLADLDAGALARQAELEERCTALREVLARAGASPDHIDGVFELAKLHRRLLAARAAAAAVLATAEGRGQEKLASEVERLERQLAQPNIDPELHGAVTSQVAVVRGRLAAQIEAERRVRVLDAELERIRDQVSLIREQALLASDAASVARSVDVLTAFLNESNRWLRDQQDIFGDLDAFAPDFPVATETRRRAAGRVGESQ
jgi:hypothetical protein